MDNQNQNTNGVFGSSTNQQKPIASNLDTENNGLETNTISKQNQMNLNSAESIRQTNPPTLDSILNGNNLNPSLVGERKPNDGNMPIEEKEKFVVENIPNMDSLDINTIPNNMLKADTIEPENSRNVEVLDQIKEETIVENKETNENRMENRLTPESQTKLADFTVPQMETLENTNTSTQMENNVVEAETPNSTSVDEFSQVPLPPVFEDSSKKKEHDGKRSIIIILIIILIGAIGVGVYYFLTLAKGSATNFITTKEIKVELGSALSKNIEDYATISGYDKNACILNLNEVNVNKVSTYKYRIICGKENVEGTIIVDDSTKPEAITNDLVLLPNATIKAEDFIEKCLDASKCTYKFKTDVSTITSSLGEHEIEIIISDEYNNQNTVKAKLTIANQAPVKYLKCSKPEETAEDIQAKIIDSYKIGIDARDNFYNATRSTEFYFHTISNYKEIVNNYKAEIGIKNRIGAATFNEGNKLITIKENKTLEDMNKDLNGRLPNNTNVLRAYLSGLGYICE